MTGISLNDHPNAVREHSRGQGRERNHMVQLHARPQVTCEGEIVLLIELIQIWLRMFENMMNPSPEASGRTAATVKAGSIPVAAT